MNIRIGYCFGAATPVDAHDFELLVGELERLDFDSVWFIDHVASNVPDPTVAMAVAAGCTTQLKLGTSVMVLPGHNPIIAATQLATLDRLSGGRLLPAVGLGVAHPPDQQALGIERSQRGPLLDEMLAVMRLAWTGEPVNHRGEHFHYEGVQVAPIPCRGPLEVWLGGAAPSELRRVGRLADGWLPGLITPDGAAQGREVIARTASEHGRTIHDDHFGVMIPYSMGPLPAAFADDLAARHPEVAPSELVPSTWDGLLELIDRFVAVGISKFVVTPLVAPPNLDAWIAHLGEAGSALVPRQT